MTTDDSWTDTDLALALRAGLIAKRWRGGYRMTAVKGKVYYREALNKYPDLRAQLSKQIDKWEAGEMTEAERREALVELVLRARARDRRDATEALADMRSQGFDPLKNLPADHELRWLDETDGDEPPA